MYARVQSFFDLFSRFMPDSERPCGCNRFFILAAISLVLIGSTGAVSATTGAAFSHELQPGWNMLSTPITLETGNDTLREILDPVEGVDVVLGYNGIWFIPNDSYRLKPLQALAVRTNRPVTATMVPSSAVTTLPTRYLTDGVQLVGPAPAPEDGVFPAMPIDQALISARQTADGKDGYIMVVSPAMNQPGWGYARGGPIHDLLPFAGYWIVMENPDTLIGFSTTPIQETPSPQIVWLDYADDHGYDQIQRMATNDESVFSAGKYVAPDKRTQFAVRAYAQDDDVPVWSSLTDLGKGINIANSVDAGPLYVAAAGGGVDQQGNRFFVVKVFNASTGNVLWTDTYDNGGGWNEAYDVVIDGDTVTAVGTGRTSGGSDEFLVRTYNIVTGNLVWSDTHSGGGGQNAALAAESSPQGLFAGGYTETPDGRRQFTLRSYNPLNGAVLWSDSYDRGFGYNEVLDIGYRNGSVVASGEGKYTDTGIGLVIRCYEPLTGALRWQESNSLPASSADNLALSDDRVVVSGLEPDVFFLKAYDLETGVQVWDDTLANDGWFNFFTAVDYDSGLLTAAAFDQWIEPGDLSYQYALTVRNYNAETGVLIDEESETGQGLSGGVDILISGNSVYVGGPWFGSDLSAGLLDSPPANQTVVTTSGRQILINGNPFYVKGVNYQPSPIGSDNSWDPFGDWFQDYWYTVFDRDIPQIKAMNANAVKTYAITAWAWGDPSQTLIFHDQFYQALADNGMYAVPMVYTQEASITGFSNSTWQSDPTMQQWLAILAEGRNETSVLGWCVGNELNGGDSMNNTVYWQNYNSIIGIIKANSPDKITMIGVVDDSMATPDFADQYMTSLDVWGINSYRGNLDHAFDVLFTTYDAASAKPLLITEWGPPSSTRNSSGDAVLLPDNATLTADYLEIHWHNSLYKPGVYDSMMENNATCQGSFIFEWTDEWDKIDPPTVQNPSPNQNINFPGGWWDEEWFGMNGIQVNGRDPDQPTQGNPDTLLPRASVERMRSLWAHYPS